LIAIINANLVRENGILWDASLLIDQGRIVDLGKSISIPEDAEIIDAAGAYVGPGFVDIHVHGGGGYSTVNEPLETAEFFLGHGTTTILLTPDYELPFQEFLSAIRRGKEAMKTDGVGKMIAGFYMERPYMNPDYGAGAFRNPWRHPMDPAEFQKLVDEAGESAKVWAIAPEREGLQPFLEYARKINPQVQFAVGHSEATPDQIEMLGNRYRPVLQTHSTNATGRVNGGDGVRGVGPDEYCLCNSEIYTEMICDSHAIHVLPQMQRMILHCKGLDKVILITDSTTKDNPNPSEFAHIKDLNFDEQGGLSGSKLTMDQACRNLMTHTNCGIAQAFLLASRNPARVLGMDHEIGSVDVGKKANLVFVDDRIHVQKVMLEGKFV